MKNRVRPHLLFTIKLGHISNLCGQWCLWLHVPLLTLLFLQLSPAACWSFLDNATDQSTRTSRNLHKQMDPNDWMGLYVNVCLCRVSVDRNKCVFKGSSTLRHWRQLSWNNYLFIYFLSGCRSQAAEGHLEIISEQSSSVPPLPLSDRASSVHSPHRPGAHRWTSSCDCPLCANCASARLTVIFFPCGHFRPKCALKKVRMCYRVILCFARR